MLRRAPRSGAGRVSRARSRSTTRSPTSSGAGSSSARTNTGAPRSRAGDMGLQLLGLLPLASRSSGRAVPVRPGPRLAEPELPHRLRPAGPAEGSALVAAEDRPVGVRRRVRELMPSHRHRPAIARAPDRRRDPRRRRPRSPPRARSGKHRHHARGRRRVRAAGDALLDRQGLVGAAAPGAEGVLSGSDSVSAPARRHDVQVPGDDRLPRPATRRRSARG